VPLRHRLSEGRRKGERPRLRIAEGQPPIAARARLACGLDRAQPLYLYLAEPRSDAFDADLTLFDVGVDAVLT
jgi:hypothetical protein